MAVFALAYFASWTTSSDVETLLRGWGLLLPTAFGFSVKAGTWHWYDFIVGIPERQILYLDSLYDSTGAQVAASRSRLVNFLKQIDPTLEWTVRRMERGYLIQQIDQVSCGIFALAYQLVSLVILSKHPKDLVYVLLAIRGSVTPDNILVWRRLLFQCATSGVISEELLALVKVPDNIEFFTLRLPVCHLRRRGAMKMFVV